MTWSRGVLAAILLLCTAACNPDGTSSQPNGNVIFNQPLPSHGCTGSQTIITRNGDNLTILVLNHVGGTYSVERVVNVVANMNGIANRNWIHANQQYRFPTHCDQ